MEAQSISDLAYAAALIDVKGSFSINARAAQLVFTTTSAVLVEFMVDMFRGKAIKQGNSYRVHWKYEDMESFIRLILPYLKTSKPQAELVLDFLNRNAIVIDYSNQMAKLNTAKRARKQTKVSDESASSN